MYRRHHGRNRSLTCSGEVTILRLVFPSSTWESPPSGRWYKYSSLSVGKCPAEAIRKSLEGSKILLEYQIFGGGSGRRMKRPLRTGCRLLELLSTLHELRPMRLGETPHASANLGVRQRAIRIV